MIQPAQRIDLQRLALLPDAQVVTRILDGETALFELIMRRYNRRLFRIARGILGNDDDAEDALQEAYVCAWLKLHQFQGPEGLAAWLCQITTNEALMRRRRRKGVQLKALGPTDDPAEVEATMRQLESPDAGPDAELHARQLQHLLERAIDALPTVYRDAFVLREVERLSVTETARCLRIEEGAVKTRVHRARKLLQCGITDELAAALAETFEFAGARCDRIVAKVFHRLNELPSGSRPEERA